MICLQSDFTQGIVARPGAKIVVENTTFENFYSGIVVHKGAQVCISTYKNIKSDNCLYMKDILEKLQITNTLNNLLHLLCMIV